MRFKSFKTVKIFMIKIKFVAKKICIKILFCNHYFNSLDTFMRKGKDPESDPEPDPHPDPYL
jgi:hypothetical protein